jgi:hypothetical protein
MMGCQTVDQSQLFYLFNLEQQIPADHLLRRLNPIVTRVLVDLRDGGNGNARGLGTQRGPQADCQPHANRYHFPSSRVHQGIPVVSVRRTTGSPIFRGSGAAMAVDWSGSTV